MRFQLCIKEISGLAENDFTPTTLGNDDKLCHPRSRSCEVSYNGFHYIDRSVLLENTSLVKFIRNYIREPSGVFSISSQVRILMTSFPALSRPFVQTVSKIWRAIDLSM